MYMYNVDLKLFFYLSCIMYMYMYVTTRVHVCLSFPAVQELTQLQDKHATRPDVFDDVEEEQEIEILTQEITQVHVLLVWHVCYCGISHMT